MTDTPMGYAGRSPCGCVRAVALDDAIHPERSRRDVTSFMRNGMFLERMNVDEMRAALCTKNHRGGCPCRTKVVS